MNAGSLVASVLVGTLIGPLSGSLSSAAQINPLYALGGIAIGLAIAVGALLWEDLR